MNSFRMCLWTLLVCSIPVASASSAEETPETDAHFDYLLKRLQKLSVQNGDETAILQAKPLFRWQNPVSGANGAVFVWSLQDRPVALAKTHLNDQKQHYVETLVAVSAKPFDVNQGSSRYWSPPGNQQKSMLVRNIDPPADAAGIRLTQMRTIARQFRFTSFWGEGNRSEWELRLLSTPLHRYRSPNAGVLDGAIFGFAQGTNPEAIVLVEAIETSMGKQWKVTVQRMSGYAIKAWRDDALVFDVPNIQNTRTNEEFFYLHERPRPYPFPMPEKAP